MIKRAAIIGAGPAGLMAADVIAARSGAAASVTLYDQMPRPARKFLLAGRGGLNLSNTADGEAFRSAFSVGRSARPRPVDGNEELLPLTTALRAFDRDALNGWLAEVGVETFVGSSERVFPTAMKASPMLRAWLKRLGSAGVKLETRHRLAGIDARGALTFETPQGTLEVNADAVVLAMGGASWPRLGSDGNWCDWLSARGIPTAPFRPSNAGVLVTWSRHLIEQDAGAALKRVAVTVGTETRQGDLVITERGLEGGPIYALGPDVREAIQTRDDGDRRVTLAIDLRPDVKHEALRDRLERTRKGQSLAKRLRSAAGLSPASARLIREPSLGPLPETPDDLARRIKACMFDIEELDGLDRAISSVGGVRLDAVDRNLRTVGDGSNVPIFVAGEMLDWDAPTGGYLLHACFATGHSAGLGVLDALGLSGS